MQLSVFLVIHCYKIMVTLLNTTSIRQLALVLRTENCTVYMSPGKVNNGTHKLNLHFSYTIDGKNYMKAHDNHLFIYTVIFFCSSRNSEDVKNAQLNLISSKTGTSKISVPVTPPVNGVSTGRNTNFENYEDHCNVKVS